MSFRRIRSATVGTVIAAYPFSGEALAAASIPLDRGDRVYLYLRVDLETGAVVELQNAHFLSYAVARHPQLLAALEIADLVGIDRDEIFHIVPILTEQTSSEDRVFLLGLLIRLCG